MKRILMVLFWMVLVIPGAFFGISAAAYWVAYFFEGLFRGGAGVGNILVLVLAAVMIVATLLTLAERKWSAAMQDRVGPNRAHIEAGPTFIQKMRLGGLLHIPADVLKMLWKEDFMPAGARSNRFLFNLAPMLAFAPVFVLFCVVPAGPMITLGEQARKIALIVSNPDFGLLYVFAIASLAVYGTSLAGWSSNNKFALLGGVRASSQMISYEVALGLGLVGMMMTFSTVRLFDMTEAQTQYLWKFTDGDFGLPAWGIFLQPVGFLLFFAAAFAETKRAPFDVPEGESEIIGYFVEYSGMRFGLFMISEFVEVVVLAAICTAIFFGGWHLPFGEKALYAELFTQGKVFYGHQWIWGAFLGSIFWLKVLALCWVQLLIRWTFPRFRYDQIQTLGWKMLLPAGLVNVFVTGALVLWDPSLRWLAVLGIAVLVAIVALATLGTGGEEAAHAHDGHGGHGADAHGHDAHASVPAHVSGAIAPSTH
ncbi:MAG: NADH-quinone oxidoreductase subunit H [Myxococcaceae bacterium]|nr:NADH-quinone oxidoreductase subunit H [Myxococcaceae bacterium]